MYVLTVDPLVAVVGFAALALYVAYWAYRLAKGVPFRPVASLVGSALYLGLFFLVEGGSWIGVGATAPLDLFLLGLAGLLGAAYSFDSTRILRYPDGHAGYRTRAAIPVAWVALFTLSIAAEVIFLGQVNFFGVAGIQGIPNPAPAFGVDVAAPASFVLGLVDALFALSTGLLLGQTAGIGSRFLRHRWVARRAPPSARAGG
jgi:hypothetical protein